MSFLFRPALFVSACCLFAASCSKSDADTFTGPVTGTDTTTVTANSCPIAQETYTQPSSVEPQWNIYYGADGDFFNAAGFNSSGMKTSNALTGIMTLTLATNGATGTYNFDKNIFTDQPTQYIFTAANGVKETRTITYNSDGTLRQIALDSVSVPLAAVTFTYGMGNLTQLDYKKLTGDSALSTFYIVTYDGNASPQHALTGSAYLYYNWEYFSTPFLEMGRVFQHLSKNNWTHFYCMQNGVKTFDEAITYQYNSEGYPTTGSLTLLTYSSGGATLTTNGYTVTYTYPCQ